MVGNTRRYYSSDGTFWSLIEGTHANFWCNIRSGKNYPDVLRTELEIINSLFIFDKEII